jgi:hypothetical protein
MKNQKIVLFVMAFLVLTLSCDGPYLIERETGESVSFDGYKTIVIGWLDLNEYEWKQHKFKNKDEWIREIRRINCGIVQKQLRDILKNRTLRFAASKDSALPVKGDLFISFKNISIEKNWSVNEGRADYLHVTVKFTDLAAKKEVYSAELAASSLHGDNYTFTGRLTGEAENLVRFIGKKLATRKK